MTALLHTQFQRLQFFRNSIYAEINAGFIEQFIAKVFEVNDNIVQGILSRIDRPDEIACASGQFFYRVVNFFDVFEIFRSGFTQFSFNNLAEQRNLSEFLPHFIMEISGNVFRISGKAALACCSKTRR